MNSTEIKNKIWDKIHKLAVGIDPVQLIGVDTIWWDGRQPSKSESQQAQNQHRKILKEILKKSKKGEG